MEAPVKLAPFTAKKVLVVYEGSGQDSDNPYDPCRPFTDIFISSHRVSQSGELLEGTPLTRQTLSEICALVMPGMGSVDYLPENVLAYSPGKILLWWTKASSRTLFFTSESGIKSGKYALPPLLFCARGNKSLYTWALKDNTRPVPSTKVFHSPFYNVYETGECCMGNITLPTNLFPASVKEWENVFFEGLLTAHLPPKFAGIEPQVFWKGMKGRKRFPLEHLKAFSTLSGIIGSLGGSR